MVVAGNLVLTLSTIDAAAHQAHSEALQMVDHEYNSQPM
jgi:hypothetical protein